MHQFHPQSELQIPVDTYMDVVKTAESYRAADDKKKEAALEQRIKSDIPLDGTLPVRTAYRYARDTGLDSTYITKALEAKVFSVERQNRLIRSLNAEGTGTARRDMYAEIILQGLREDHPEYSYKVSRSEDHIDAYANIYATRRARSLLGSIWNRIAGRRKFVTVKSGTICSGNEIFIYTPEALHTCEKVKHDLEGVPRRTYSDLEMKLAYAPK